MAAPEVVHLAFEQSDFFGLFIERSVLKQKDVGIGDVDRRGERQSGHPLVWLAFEYGKRCPDKPVALGGIEKSSVDHTVGHSFDAYLWSGVNAYDLHFQSAAAGNVGGCYGHAVIVGIDHVCVRMRGQQ